MWQTSRGIRKLEGAESRLFCAGVLDLMDNLAMEFDDDWQEDPTVVYPSGVALFDALTPAQRIGALHDVSRSLLTDDPSSPEANAVEESTIAAVFMEIRDQVAIEIKFRDAGSSDSTGSSDSGRDGESGSSRVPADDVDGEGQRWRTLVLAAQDDVCRADGVDETDELRPRATMESRDMPTWDAIIENLMDGVLWDRDFELADVFLDADPGVADHRRAVLGIGKDYFSDVAADPPPAQIAQMIAEIRALVHRKPR